MEGGHVGTSTARPGRLRVAMITFDFGELLVPMANALSRDADVLLALPTHELDPLRSALEPDVQPLAYAKPRLRQPLRQVRACGRIVRAVLRFDPDVVHLQQGHLWFNLLALPLLRRRPLVVTIHDQAPHLGDRGGQKTPQPVMDLAFKRADQLIVHAEQLKRDVVARLGLEPERIHVIPHVAIGPLADAAAPREDEDPHAVLFFGRIWPYKGLDHLIAAQPLITEQVGEARFVIAGEGEDLARYRVMMRDPSRFTVINRFVSIEERTRLFAQAALVVLPYVEASQSGVVPVAFAAGKPVVATAVGGLPEVVEDGRTGFVVPPGDARALAAAVVHLLQRPDSRHEMGRAGRRKLEREWSATAVAGPTLRVYELARCPPGASPVDPGRYGAAAGRLHGYLLERFWRDDALIGPDFGVRLNYRIGRFAKSYLRALPWRDDLYYLQAQAYWTLANWTLTATGDGRADAVATNCAHGMVDRQRDDGAWDYPNREWRGRVANAEGSWAAIALAESYRRTGDGRFLEAALRWCRYLEAEIGYERVAGGLAARYFAGRGGSAVPNNTAFVLRLLAELADAAGDERLLAHAPALVGFLAEAQRPSGEIPYEVDLDARPVRLHFQCPQYNAFQCLDLVRYRQLTGDPAADTLIGGTLRFLQAAVDADGAVPYGCDARTPNVTYHAAAVAAALNEGARLGQPGCAEVRDRVGERFLALQGVDGSFPHSRHDYGILSDRRAYPRPLSMILHHLLALRTSPVAAPAR